MAIVAVALTILRANGVIVPEWLYIGAWAYVALYAVVSLLEGALKSTTPTIPK